MAIHVTNASTIQSHIARLGRAHSLAVNVATQACVQFPTHGRACSWRLPFLQLNKTNGALSRLWQAHQVAEGIEDAYDGLVV